MENLRVCQAAFFLTLLHLATSSHFRGGTIQWKPATPFNGSITIAYQVSWRRSVYYCDYSTISSGILRGEGSLYCTEGCNNTYVGDMLYRCTAFNVLDDWSYGRNEILFPATGVSYFELQFSSCCWLSTLQIGRDGGWSLKASGNVLVRQDTGEINSSPEVTMPLDVNVQAGCISQIRVDAWDPDGDTVRCRWASSSQSECGDVCNTFPNFALNPDTCVITFYGDYIDGMFVVAIQVEDFAAPTDTYSLSSVPLQFVVNVVSANNESSITCDETEYLPPTFIPPTPRSGTCIPVLRGQTWNGRLLAQSQSNLSSVEYIAVTGATPYVVRRNVTHLYIEVAWSATDGSLTRLICFNATDNHGISSDTQCATLLVMESTSGIETNVLSDNAVGVNWTFSKPAPFGFNVTVYQVINAAEVRPVKTNLIPDSCLQSTQFSGLDEGVPYQVIVKGINEVNETSETIASTFFVRQQAPIVPPHGISHSILPNNAILLKWSQPTLNSARGFVIGYSLIYSCARSNSINLIELYEVTEDYFLLRAVNDSAVTCSVALCAKTIAGCGPLSQPVIVQEFAAGSQSSETYLQSQAQTYLILIYVLSSIIALGMIIAIAISIRLCYAASSRSRKMISIGDTKVEMVEHNTFAT